ncbi:hypothetical protein [Microbispora sp. NBC_01389]|uniref:hypothetical protein n=1 Tax=Microbispora sp. NBC_01389 TaxID=2903584 RepID=UPI0032440C15
MTADQAVRPARQETVPGDLAWAAPGWVEWRPLAVTFAITAGVFGLLGASTGVLAWLTPELGETTRREIATLVLAPGLLITTWFGRSAAHVVAGVIVSLILVVRSTMTGVPKKMGSFVWHPVGAGPTQDYAVSVGAGRLDLTDVSLAPGTRARFVASVSVGQLKVIVPPTARVEVHGIARLGEVKIDHKVEAGANIQIDRVLEPEVTGTGDAPTIELRINAGVGDIEVRASSPTIETSFLVASLCAP